MRRIQYRGGKAIEAAPFLKTKDGTIYADARQLDSRDANFITFSDRRELRLTVVLEGPIVGGSMVASVAVVGLPSSVQSEVGAAYSRVWPEDGARRRAAKAVATWLEGIERKG